MIGAEDASELIQDTIATAAGLLHRAEAAGKKVAASTVAYFAVKLTRSGRRSRGSSGTDVMLFRFTKIWEKIIVIIRERWTGRILINQERVEPRFA
jgi:hypothetical protein